VGWGLVRGVGGGVKCKLLGGREGVYGLCDGGGSGCECEGVDLDGVEGGG